MSKLSKEFETLRKKFFGDKKRYDDFEEDFSPKRNLRDWDLDERSSEKGFTRYSESAWSKKYGFKGGSYSNYFFGDNFSLEDKELIRKGYAMAASFVRALIPDRAINIFFMNSEDGGLQEKENTLKVSNKVFEDKTIDSSERMDVFIGESIHECCHLIYTDSSVKFPDHVIKRSIFNVIEDERVESELSQEYPGYINYISKSKKYFYEIDFVKKISESVKTLNDSQKMLMAIFHLIRYPKNLTEEDKTKFGKLLNDVKKVLTPFAKTTQDSLDCAEEIYKLLLKFNNSFEAEMKEKSTKDMLEGISEKSGKSSGKSGGKGGSKETPTLPDFSKMSDKDKEKMLKNLLKQMMENLEKNISEGFNGSDSKEEKEETFKGKNSSEIIKDSKLSKESQKFYKELIRRFNLESKNVFESEKGKTQKVSEGFNELGDIGNAKDSLKEPKNCSSFGNGTIKNEFSAEMYKNYGGGISGTNTKTLFFKVKEDANSYQKIREKVSAYSSTLSKVLRFNSVDKKLVNKSTRNGYLDTNKLAEARQGVPTVYERYGHAKSDKIAICLLIDQSGSMGGSKINKAAECAVLLAEALKKNKDIELFVYGHTADLSFRNSVDMRIYKEPNYDKIYSMGNIPNEVLYENADGYAIYEAAKRVRKFTSRPCVMFVLSDGNPACNAYCSMDGIAHTRKMVKKITKEENMQVIQVAIENYVSSEQMFEHFVKFTNLSKLPNDIGKFVKKIVTKMMKVDIVNY